MLVKRAMLLNTHRGHIYGNSVSSNVRHVSVRVPWQDRPWDGSVCHDPLGNASCLALKLIAEGRDDAVEAGIADASFDELSQDQVPPCLRTSVAFLASRGYSVQSVMAYSRWSRDHKHMLPRTLHLPAYGAQIVPYRWMLRESGFALAAELELDVDPDREPTEPSFLQRTSWVQHHQHQRLLLDAFATPLVEEKSLVFFYAVRTPLCDDERRVLLGAALLKKKHPIDEYMYTDGAHGRLRSMVWERSIQHSLRPRRGSNAGYTGGFVMPYHAILRHAAQDESCDPGDFVAWVPQDARAQFSYGSEQVSHGGGAAALLAARSALEKISGVLDGPWAEQIQWIDEQLSALWRMQGPAPGLGVVLSTLHKGFNGTLFAIALADSLQPNEDPWPLVDAVFSQKRSPPAGSPPVTTALRARWTKVRTDPVRYDALRLLARLELTKSQAARATSILEPAALLENPYRLYEIDRTAADPIPFAVLDRGIYPGVEVAKAHPLPERCNPILAETDNPLRLRGACTHVLEEAAADGNTILPADHLTDAANELTLTRPLPLDADLLDIFREEFAPTVLVGDDAKSPTAQLDRYITYGRLITDAVQLRLAKPAAPSLVSWANLLAEKFGRAAAGDLAEHRARHEKVVALERLAHNRISALIGPAGTGKTAVLDLLLQQPDIVGPRIRLLAPTGKARVRLGEETGRQAQAQTIAQFLLTLDRYDRETGRYFPNAGAARIDTTTCIVDEASMLTEDMLAAILDALQPSCRVILVGDPYQLPPIGAGCPFVDLIEYLRRDHAANGIAELTVPRRQSEGGGATSSPLERSDVQLAAIFSGRALPAGDDEIAERVLAGIDDAYLRTRQWEQTSQLPDLLRSVFQAEFGVEGAELAAQIEASLGATRNPKGYLNFENGCSDLCADWQILCVNRTQSGGSVYLNRHIKQTYRADRLETAIRSNQVPPYRDWFRSIKPRGPEQITYGDKVICVRNHFRRPYVFPPGEAVNDEEYIANGEIGIVTGQTTYGKSNPKFTNVEFSGRPDRNFGFSASAFREEGQPFLELAYAISVHKAQGSQFGVVILVLPAHSRLISREMIYTALTRQKRRIWILHQGSFDRILAHRHPVFSDIAARFTNLFHTCNPQPVQPPSGLPPGLLLKTRGFLEDRLLHRTLRGDRVSSKSELAIANILHGLEREGLLRA